MNQRQNSSLQCAGWTRSVPASTQGQCDASFKRLEEGVFQFPNADTTGVEIKATDLALILGGIDLHSAKRRPRYERPVSA
jgi:hypothetical protein